MTLCRSVLYQQLLSRKTQLINVHYKIRTVFEKIYSFCNNTFHDILTETIGLEPHCSATIDSIQDIGLLSPLTVLVFLHVDQVSCCTYEFVSCSISNSVQPRITRTDS